jgi:hypothetical protein
MPSTPFTGIVSKLRNSLAIDEKRKTVHDHCGIPQSGNHDNKIKQAREIASCSVLTQKSIGMRS